MVCNNVLLLLVTLLTSCKAMEPEPALYSTSMEVDSNATTGTTTPMPVHTVELKVALSDVSQVTSEAALLSEITASLRAASGDADASVNITIKHITVVSVFKGLPEIDVNSIIDAYYNMTAIPKVQITVNGNSYTGGRRLAETATVNAKVAKGDNSDVVVKTKATVQATSVSAMVSALQQANPTKYGTLTASTLTLDPVTTELSVKTVVTGVATAPTQNSISTQLAQKISGGANVTSVSVTTEVYTTTTQSVEDNGAPILSLIAGWGVCFGLLMA